VAVHQHGWIDLHDETNTRHPPKTLDSRGQVNAAPIRHSICFSAIASCDKYNNTPQREKDEGAAGRGGIGFAAAAVALLSLR
jgi:hypothetical protein